MATKTFVLVVASLALTAVAIDLNASKKKITIDPIDAKEMATEWEAALQEEIPLIREEEAKEKKLRAKALLAHKPDTKKDKVDLSDPFGTGAWASDFEKDVSSLIMGLQAGGFGATPFGDSVQKISALIEGDMMPKVTDAHDTDQKELNRLFDEIGACKTTMDSEQVTASLKEAEYKTKSTEHKTCRSQEAALYTTNVDCHKNWIAAKDVAKGKCDAHEDLETKLGETTNNQEIMSKAPLESVESYIGRISETICGKPFDCSSCGSTSGTAAAGDAAAGDAAAGDAAAGTTDGTTTGTTSGGDCPDAETYGIGMLDDLNCHKTACDDATKVYNDLTEQCAKDDKAWIEKRSECDIMQNSMDTLSCDYSMQTKDLCEKYESCHHTKKTAYDEFKLTVKGDPDATPEIPSRENDRKAEWRGLKRMKCLIDAFTDGEVTHAEIETCKAFDHTTEANTLLSIVYHDVELLESEDCIVSNMYSATAEYKAIEFTPLPALAKGQGDANECAGLNEQSTTPASGSPATCNCIRVPMDGPYTAGAVVKCMDCTDVSSTAQTSSCPVGTKIFSPSSRADWETFLKSADPWNTETGVVDPHFIVDVTCPQTDCNPQISSDGQAAESYRTHWVTADGSKWWLRASANTQELVTYTLVGDSYCRGPNGDSQLLDEVRYTNIADADACKTKCDAEGACTAYHFKTSDGDCLIHSGAIQAESVLGKISGDPSDYGHCYKKEVTGYTPDCYVGLTMPSSATADEITWKQDMCSYHSKSYYCQAESITLAPGGTNNPTGCVCKKVELVGLYSAGYLIKCEKCLDVYKSTDVNSCPAGTKIFSPRTRDDWTTFLSSATPLRNPHWIIDVTRPQDGCGESCKAASMKSGVPAQATWHTSDNSPWFLRDDSDSPSSYSQPTGDYTANCFLDLTNSPANADDVHFDDHSCYVHSRSYYCQSLGTTTTTTTAAVTCTTYTCQTVNWIKKADVATTANPTEAVCCEATCAVYACVTPGWNPKTGVNSLAGSEENCCEATCDAYTCQTAHWVKKNLADGLTDPSEAQCCEATCQAFTCTPGLTMRSGVESLTSPSDQNCCEGVPEDTWNVLATDSYCDGSAISHESGDSPSGNYATHAACQTACEADENCHLYLYRYDDSASAKYTCALFTECKTYHDFADGDGGSIWIKPTYDTALSAYWDSGNCGPHGNDYQWSWCSSSSFNCPDEVDASSCASGKASLVFKRGTGACCSSVTIDGCNYAYYAQYVCTTPTATLEGSMWCGGTRTPSFPGMPKVPTITECMAQCKATYSDCTAVEYWDGGATGCFMIKPGVDCTKTSYTNENDGWWRVWVMDER